MTACSSHPVPPPMRHHGAPRFHRNQVLVPASQLIAMEAWQRRANELPDGSVLLVLPAGSDRLDMAGQRIRFALHEQKRAVTVATVD